MAGGAIVNLSSAATLGMPGVHVHYAASKAAIDALTFGLAQEVAAEGFRVNGVSPGIIGTEIHAAAGYPDRVKRVSATLPMQRAGTAEAVVWLLSHAASYVNGATLSVSGGR